MISFSGSGVWLLSDSDLKVSLKFHKKFGNKISKFRIFVNFKISQKFCDEEFDPGSE